MAPVTPGAEGGDEPPPVYRIPGREILDRAGAGVMPGPPRMTERISGGESDMPACQRLRQLLSSGPVRGAFRPGDATVPPPPYVRQARRTVGDRSRRVLHLRKATAGRTSGPPA